MAVYVNDGHEPSDGLPWKHLDARCPLLLEVAANGFSALRVRNVDAHAPLDRHVRRRCPICFTDGPPLVVGEAPAWVQAARAPKYAPEPGFAWVYDIMWPPEHLSQVGMASNLAERFRSRWRGTLNGRIRGADSIWWYYDLLRQDPNVELEWTAERFPRDVVVTEERRLRDRKRAAVSSDV